MGNYAYATSENALWVNLYMGSDVTVTLSGADMQVHQTTTYPWDGNVVLDLGLQKPVRGEVRLRIPGWCKDYTLTVNGTAVQAPEEKGYAVLSRKWKDKDRIELILSMPVEVVAADPRVKEDEGKRAVQRGPIVYCMEQVDNPEGFDSLRLTEGMEFRMEKLPKRQWWGHEIMQITARDGEEELVLIPYFAWDNREAGKMKVWIPYND